MAITVKFDPNQAHNLYPRLRVDADGFIVAVEGEAILGYHAPDVIGLPLLQFTPSSERYLIRTQWEQSIERLQASTQAMPQRLNAHAIHRDGHLIALTMHISLIPTTEEYFISLQDRGLSTQQIKRLETVNELALSLRNLDVNDIMEQVYQHLNRLLSIQFFFIALYEAESDKLYAQCIYEAGQRLPDRIEYLGDQSTYSEWVIRNRKPIIIDRNRPTPTGAHTEAYPPPMASCVFVPMLVQNTVIGLMSVQTDKDYQFEDDEIEVFEGIAAQAAVAISNARLYSDTKRRLHEMSRLHELTESISTTTTEEQLFELVLQGIRDVFETPFSLIETQLHDAEQSKVSPPEQQHIATTRFLATIKSITMPTLIDTQSAAWQDEELGLEMMLVLPLKFGDQRIGTLVTGQKETGRLLPDQLNSMGILATHAVAALHNIRLLEDAQDRTAELEKAYAELQSLDQLRQELVDNVSHELRSPLSFVRAYVELMSLGELGEINKAQLDALKIIDRKTDGMLRLINDILEMEKIRPETLQRQAEDIVTVVRQAYQAALLAYVTQNVVFTLNIPDTSLVLDIDVLRIEQVMSNLISNAVKFSPEGGMVHISCTILPDAVWIAVEDQGTGIEADKIDRIFERFYRVPGIPQDGIGIGLSIVKQIVTAHGGQIRVESETQKGTRFAFSLPR